MPRLTGSHCQRTSVRQSGTEQKEPGEARPRLVLVGLDLPAGWTRPCVGGNPSPVWNSLIWARATGRAPRCLSGLSLVPKGLSSCFVFVFGGVSCSSASRGCSFGNLHGWLVPSELETFSAGLGGAGSSFSVVINALYFLRLESSQ